MPELSSQFRDFSIVTPSTRINPPLHLPPQTFYCFSKITFSWKPHWMEECFDWYFKLIYQLQDKERRALWDIGRLKVLIVEICWQQITWQPWSIEPHSNVIHGLCLHWCLINETYFTKNSIDIILSPLVRCYTKIMWIIFTTMQQAPLDKADGALWSTAIIIWW